VSKVAVRVHSAVLRGMRLAWATVPISGAPRLPMMDIIVARMVSVIRRVRVEGVVALTGLFAI
jgi:hypothetical protein